jgi:hypothetical protein
MAVIVEALFFPTWTLQYVSCFLFLSVLDGCWSFSNLSKTSSDSIEQDLPDDESKLMQPTQIKAKATKKDETKKWEN